MISAFAIIVTAMVSIHFLFVTLADKMIFYDTGHHISASNIHEIDAIMSISKITGSDIDSPTIYSSLLWGTTGNAKASANEIQNFFSAEFLIPLPKLWCEKISDFLNTELHYPLSCFFFKWYLIISVIMPIICLLSNILFPSKVIKIYLTILPAALKVGITIGGALSILIAGAGLPILIMYVCAAFAIVTTLAIVIVYFYGLLILPISVLHLVIGCIIAVFEKIKEIFSKNKAETSAP